MKTPGLRAAWNQQRKQQLLRKEYGIQDSKTIVVERKNAITNTLRLLLQALWHVLHFVATLTIAFLAFVGLAALIYPDTRISMISHFDEAIIQLIQFL